MSRNEPKISVSGEDAQEFSRWRRFASALVQHPYTRSTLLRRGLFSAVLAFFWLLAGVSRLGEGGTVVAGFCFLGAVFFGVRAVAMGAIMTTVPLGEDWSKRSGNVEDS